MKSITFILFGIGIFFITTNAYAQQTYTVYGTVFDNSSNQSIENAQVWLYGKQTGDVTDKLGHFKFQVFKMHSETRIYVRICGEEIATSKLVDFDADTFIRTEFFVNNIKSDCPVPPNIPWEVTPSESVNYKGHVILSQGGDFFNTCNGDSYSPIWTEDFNREEIWPDNSQLGDSLFIKLNGRLDTYSKDLVPFQKLYVGEIVMIKESNRNDCKTK